MPSKEYNRQYRLKNKDILIAKRKAAYKAAKLEAPEKVLQKHKELYIKYKARINKASRNWYKENTEKAKAHRVGRKGQKTMFSSAKTRARKQGLAFNIEVSDIVIPTHCPVLGIELKAGKGRKISSSPVLDRIIPAKGYTKGNIAVISDRANHIKSNASLDELEKLTIWLRSKSSVV